MEEKQQEDGKHAKTRRNDEPRTTRCFVSQYNAIRVAHHAQRNPDVYFVMEELQKHLNAYETQNQRNCRLEVGQIRNGVADERVDASHGADCKYLQRTGSVIKHQIKCRGITKEPKNKWGKGRCLRTKMQAGRRAGKNNRRDDLLQRTPRPTYEHSTKQTAGTTCVTCFDSVKLRLTDGFLTRSCQVLFRQSSQ